MMRGAKVVKFVGFRRTRKFAIPIREFYCYPHTLKQGSLSYLIAYQAWNSVIFRVYGLGLLFFLKKGSMMASSHGSRQRHIALG